MMCSFIPSASKRCHKEAMTRNWSFVKFLALRVSWMLLLKASVPCVHCASLKKKNHHWLMAPCSSHPWLLSLSPFVRPRFVQYCISLCGIVRHCAAALVLYPEPHVPLGIEVRELLNATCFFKRRLKIGSQGSTCLADLSKALLAAAHCPVPVDAKECAWTNVNIT